MSTYHEQDRALLRWIRRALTFELHQAYTRCRRPWIRAAITREL